jgi:pimeloyl-ACP methyl ester carboxylesterase
MADSCPPTSRRSAGNEAVMHPVLTPEQALGPARRLDLTIGPVEVHEVGHGRPLLFVHGLMVHAAFWRKVVPSLAEHYRCLVPTLPLGAHRLPMNTDADLSPPAIAELLAELLTDLELHDTVVVGNDTGGAYAQIMAAHHPHRVAGLVLTPCDALEHFWPWHPTRMLRQAPVPRSILGYSMLAKYDIPEDQPDRLANLITDFLPRLAAAQDGRGSSIRGRDPAPVGQENPAEHDGPRHPPTQGLADERLTAVRR